MRLQYVLYFLSIVCFCGCSRISSPNDSEVASIIDERIHKETSWYRHPTESIEEAISYLLGQELTVEGAVQIALLHNPEVQAVFEEIGIAHADLIEAGLFRNPIFEGYVRVPNKSDLVVNWQFSIAQTFLDIFLVPLKKKVAEVELQQTQMRVANAILNLAFDVQTGFYQYVSALQKNALLSLLLDATEVSSRLAILQKKQGNINDLEQQARMNEFLQAKIQYTESKTDLAVLRAQMNKLLGLTPDTSWRIPEALPDLPEHDMSADNLESIALEKRLDLNAIRWEIKGLTRILKTKQWWAFADGVLGISSEQEAENFIETGPAWTIPLPFFNYGQADRARINSIYHQMQSRLKALEISVLSDVRSANDQLRIYRELLEEYRNQLLPLQECILTTSQHFYNYMALGVYKLIEAKKRAIEIEIQYTKALLQYWKTRVDLDRALGGNLEWAMMQKEDRYAMP